MAVGVSDSTTLGQALGSDTVTPTITIGATAQQTSLSATTLSLTQAPAHRHHPLNEGDFITDGIKGNPSTIMGGSNGWQWQLFTDWQGGGQSHTHGIANPTHTHSVTSSKITLLPLARAFYYIMRVA